MLQRKPVERREGRIEARQAVSGRGTYGMRPTQHNIHHLRQTLAFDEPEKTASFSPMIRHRNDGVTRNLKNLSFAASTILLDPLGFSHEEEHRRGVDRAPSPDGWHVLGQIEGMAGARA